MNVTKLVVAAAVGIGLAACGTTVPQTTSIGSPSSRAGTGVLPSSTSTAGAPGQDGTGSGPTTPTSSGSGPAGGGSGGNGSTSSGTTSGTGTGPLADQVTSPLTIGVTYNDTSGSSGAVGFNNPTTVNAKNIVRALVQGINVGGGLAHRKLKLVEHSFNGQDANYSESASAACAQFTQDNHLPIVLDNSFGASIGGFADCMRKAHALTITSQDSGDATISARTDPLISTSYTTFDQTYASVVDTLHNSGYLTAKNKIGVLMEDCPVYTRAWQKTVEPLIARLGLAKPVTRTLSCTTGFSSAAGAASAISNAILTFNTDHVDRVMLMSVNEGLVLNIFATGADSQGYRPGFMLSSWAYTQAVTPSIPANQRPQVHGVGNVPFSDVDRATPTASDLRCFALAKVGGLNPSTDADRFLLSQECAPFMVLEAALIATNGHSDTSSLRSAIANLGNVSLPGMLDQQATLSSTQHEAPDLVQAFAYTPSCQCMRYSGMPGKATR